MNKYFLQGGILSVVPLFFSCFIISFFYTSESKSTMSDMIFFIIIILAFIIGGFINLYFNKDRNNA